MSNQSDQESIKQRVNDLLTRDLTNRSLLSRQSRRRPIEKSSAALSQALSPLLATYHTIKPSHSLLSPDRTTISEAAINEIDNPLELILLAYRDLLGRAPSQAELSRQVDRAGHGLLGRDLVLEIARNAECRAHVPQLRIPRRRPISKVRLRYWLSKLMRRRLNRLWLFHTMLADSVSIIAQQLIEVQIKAEGRPKSEKSECAPGHNFELDEIKRNLLLEIDRKFRGTDENVSRQLMFYVPILTELSALGPIIDVGCGRGVFLKLLRDHGFNALGIDNIEEHIANCVGQGLNAVFDDAYHFLSETPGESCSAVTMIHIIEHLELDQILLLLREVARILVPGGCVIIETPNPENPWVIFTTFHLDPTHIRPMPCELLMTILNLFKLVPERLHLESTLHDDSGGSTGNIHLDYLITRPANLSILGRKQ